MPSDKRPDLPMYPFFITRDVEGGSEIGFGLTNVDMTGEGHNAAVLFRTERAITADDWSELGGRYWDAWIKLPQENRSMELWIAPALRAVAATYGGSRLNPPIMLNMMDAYPEGD